MSTISKTKSSSSSKSRKETRQESGKRGGLARAKTLTPVERSRIARKGGAVTYLRYGSQHFSEIAKKRMKSLTPEQRKAIGKRLLEARTK